MHDPAEEGQDSVVYLHLKDKGPSFGDNNVHILDRDHRWFERGVTPDSDDTTYLKTLS